MKKSIITLVILLYVGISSISVIAQKVNDDFSGITINLKSSDGVNIKADLYELENRTTPFIILFHQAGFSRGEYRPIAPKLNELGYSCMAIDQRSGKEVNGVINETNKDAVKKGKSTKYPDAFPDLEAALKFVKDNCPSRKIVVWGSSYSASLVFVLGQKYKEDISGIVSFSPGEYFEFENKQIKEYAKEIECPVWFSSAKNEHDSWKGIYDQIPGANKSYYLPESKGIHDSRGLWEITEEHEKCWESLTGFLKSVE